MTERQFNDIAFGLAVCGSAAILTVFTMLISVLLAPGTTGENVAPVCADNHGVQQVATQTALGNTVRVLVVCKDGTVQSL